MEKIQVVKFYNGDEIIGCVDELDNKVSIKDAIQFYLRMDKNGSHNVAIDYWLPIPVIKNNEALIMKEHIIAILDPSDEFKEYYENALDSMKKNKADKEKLDLDDDSLSDDDKLKLILESMDIPVSRFIN